MKLLFDTSDIMTTILSKLKQYRAAYYKYSDMQWIMI